MLKLRFVTALLLAPVVLGAIALGYWTMLAATLVAVALAAYELARALEIPFPATFGAGALPVLLSVPSGASGALAGAVLVLPWTLLWLTTRADAYTLRSILALLLMALWVGTPLAHLALLEGLPGGQFLVLLAVVGPWISDTGAYFVGRLFGRHKLFPTLSPKKTVEGALGGLLLSILIAGFFAHGFLGFGIAASAVLGAAISVFSQAGDFFESALKRLLNLKDLGNFLPGHGGILDRMDSLLFSGPVVYYLCVMFAP
ncbi:MAG TPA: phosphatidate cytidylyltransferase [Rubrobacteraceae bacterium]|nr:phosphatidate cytidylyltransferase [Rubrobacteraceae bacterium]